MKLLKKMKEGLFLIPALIIAIGATVGIRANAPVFPKISAINAVAESTEKSEYVEKKTDVHDAKDTKENDSTKNVKKIAYTGTGKWKDGTYT